ncbi:Protein K11G12.5 [Aphelenchoides avenae]|nr:Protein K11G12.5 [Aphelenchus avenae]
MTTTRPKEDRIGRWYFGGMAGACAACFTHPLDLLKVHLQTQQTGSVSVLGMSSKILKSDGIMGFYNGLSASLLRQLTYSTTRFAVYETAKKQFPSDQPLPFYQKVFLAGFSGACGGVVGSPGDLVNVRMQNDMKLLAAERRNYKHALDGVYRIIREEGTSKLFNGCSMATARAVLMTIGQLSFYDQIKQMFIESGYMKDNIYTHLTSSFIAASMATVLTQPMDVLKTRLMNSRPGEFSGLADCFVYTAKLGPAGFFKGFFPAWVRLAPHTILMFVFFEQFRLNFGYFPEEKK